jgi:hypothetical protein
LAEDNEPTTTENDIKKRQLELSERQLIQDRELKEAELAIRRREVVVGRWTGPVAVAVVAGIVGIVGTFFSARETRELERKKQEGTLILEAIRTGSKIYGAEWRKERANGKG